MHFELLIFLFLFLKNLLMKIMSAAFLLLFLFTNYSCKEKGCTDKLSISYDEDAEKDDGSCEYGGLGGSVTIVASPEHHGTPIVSSSTYPDTAMVKFNAIEFPGFSPSNYDLILVGDPGEDHIHIGGLKKGKYYIFMTGFDTTINERVLGGIPYELYSSSGTVDLTIPVTED